MSDGSNAMVVVERAFRVEPEAGAGLHDRAEAVMAELVTLSDSGAILDSTVSSDLDGGIVTIEVTVAATDLDDGIAVALTAMRTAIHAVGDATPRPPSHRASAPMVARDMRAAFVDDAA